jgi:hypothetical protein
VIPGGYDSIQLALIIHVPTVLESSKVAGAVSSAIVGFFEPDDPEQAL